MFMAFAHRLRYGVPFRFLVGRDFQRPLKSSDPLLDGLPPLTRWLPRARLVSACTNWITASGAVWARAMVGGLASIVQPISAAIATKRAKGTDMVTEWVKDDMVCPLRVLGFLRLCTSMR
jgi:hypothetical protein